MKKYLLSMICSTAVMLGAVGVYAAEKEDMLPPPPPHEEMGRPMKVRGPEKLAEDLKLTAEQKAQADKIRKEGREKIKPLMEEMRDIRKKIDTEREKNMQEFEKILTPEQKEQLNIIKAAHQHRFEKRRPRMHRGEDKMHRPDHELED